MGNRQGRWSASQHLAVEVVVPATVAGVVLTVWVVSAGHAPGRAGGWAVAAVALSGAMWRMFSYQLRTREGLLVATAVAAVGVGVMAALSWAVVFVSAFAALGVIALFSTPLAASGTLAVLGMQKLAGAPLKRGWDWLGRR